MNDPTPSIATIIPCMGNANKTKRCLNSLIEDGYSKNQIIVVENGSTENVRQLEPEYSQVHFIPLSLNHGFAGGCNRGAVEAMKNKEVKILFFLNNDTTVEKGSLNCLIQVLLRHPNCGAVAPKILLEGSNRIWAAGWDWIGWRFMGRNRGENETDCGQYDVPMECKFLSGCALLLRREVIETVGLFDASFFTYIEDVDLGVRMNKSGWKLLYVPSALIYHEGSSTAGSQYAPFQSFYRWRNRLLIVWKHASPYHQAFLYFVFFPVLFIRDTFSYLIRRKFKSYKRLWQGFFQFLAISILKKNPEPLRTI